MNRRNVSFLVRVVAVFVFVLIGTVEVSAPGKVSAASCSDQACSIPGTMLSVTAKPHFPTASLNYDFASPSRDWGSTSSRGPVKCAWRWEQQWSWWEWRWKWVWGCFPPR